MGNLGDLIKWGDPSREKAMPGSVQLSGIVFSLFFPVRQLFYQPCQGGDKLRRGMLYQLLSRVILTGMREKDIKHTH